MSAALVDNGATIDITITVSNDKNLLGELARRFQGGLRTGNYDVASDAMTPAVNSSEPDTSFIEATRLLFKQAESL